MIEDIIKAAKKRGHGYRTGAGIFRASSIYQCGRKTLLEKKDASQRYPEEIEQQIVVETDNELNSADIGNAIHEYIQNTLKSIDPEAKIEQKRTLQIGDLAFVGHTDIETDKVVIDIKSIKWLKDDVIEQKAEGHLDQLAIYQMITGKNGMLLYIGRAWGGYKIVAQSFQTARNRFVDIFAKTVKLAEHEEYKTLPVIEEPYAKDHWLCKSYCAFREVCYQ